MQRSMDKIRQEWLNVKRDKEIKDLQSLAKDFPELSLPYNLLHLHDHAKNYDEFISTSLDTQRIEVFDYMLDRMLTVYKLVDER